MNIPKLSAAQWFRLVTALLPLLRGLVRVAGVSIVTVIRALIDLVVQVEALFPPDPSDPTRKRGAEKLAAFSELVIAAFATADESVADVQARIGNLGQIANVIVSQLNQWGHLNGPVVATFDQSVN